MATGMGFDRSSGGASPLRAREEARRRDAGLNFIRQSSPGIRLQTGVSTG